MTITKMSLPKIDPEVKKQQEAKSSYRTGYRMHHYKGGVFINVEKSGKNNFKWWAYFNGIRQRVTPQFFAATYELRSNLNE